MHSRIHHVRDDNSLVISEQVGTEIAAEPDRPTHSKSSTVASLPRLKKRFLYLHKFMCVTSSQSTVTRLSCRIQISAINWKAWKLVQIRNAMHVIVAGRFSRLLRGDAPD